MSNEIDTLLEELSSFKIPTPPVHSKPSLEVTDDSLNEFVIKRSTDLIDTGLDAIEDLKDFIVQGQNPEEIAALSDLISSTSKAIETLNKINLQNKKAKTDKELKILEFQNRKEVASLMPSAGGNVTNTTNVLIASREEIFKQLLKDSGDVIEAELTNTVSLSS